jgi:CRISPR-associated protein Cas2
MRRNYIVSYDIADEKRLRKVFKICRDFGDHLQYSVFECNLSAQEKIELETALGDVLNLREDQVLFIDLGATEARSEKVITALGQAYIRLDSPCYVV